MFLKTSGGAIVRLPPLIVGLAAHALCMEYRTMAGYFYFGHSQCSVARLAFLRPNSRNLAFFKVVWHENLVFGMYVIVWHFFGIF